MPHAWRSRELRKREHADGGRCWMQKQVNLERGPREDKQCSYRFATLKDAQVACESEPQCDGVTRDMGTNCVVNGADGAKHLFRYGLRSLPSKPWAAGGVTSWLLGSRMRCIGSHVQTVPPPSDSDVLCSAYTADAAPSAKVAPDHAAVQRLMLRSESETVGIDDAAISQGQCSAQRLPGLVSVDLSVPKRERCGGGSPLGEQLAQIASQAVNKSFGCDATPARCFIRHKDGRNDGWGAQHYRRATLFVSALQLGCAYVHTPLYSMNARSRAHGVDHTAAEKFFALGRGCHANKALQLRTTGCTHPLGETWVGEEPFSRTHAIAASCNSTTQGMLDAWARRHANTLLDCDLAPHAPPLSRCTWIRAIAALRQRYFDAHGGAPALPWYELSSTASAPAPTPLPGTGGARPFRSRSLMKHSALALHVALHVRRGDLAAVDPGRHVSNARFERAVEGLAPALGEMISRWHGQLTCALHVMSEGKAAALPVEAWRSVLGAHNVSLELHLDTDPFTTMHHLIGADVLIKSPSGFSDVASLYSAGVKLSFGRAKDLFLQGVPIEKPGLQDTTVRDDFLCKLHSHLRWKARAAAGFNKQFHVPKGPAGLASDVAGENGL